ITACDGALVGRAIAAGHADERDGSNLAALFPAGNGAVPTVGLLHARVAEAAGMERHPAVAPCTLADLAATGYDYWALGHVHGRQELRASDAPAGSGPLACYAGTLIGHHAGETGARGALLVTVPAPVAGQPRGAVTAEFRPLAGVRWETLDVPDLAAIADLSALRASVTEAFLRLAGPDAADGGQRWMLRVELSGPCPAAAELQRDELLEELSEQLCAELLPAGVLALQLVECGVHRPVALGSHRGQPHVLGLSLQVIDELASDEALLARLAPGALAGCDGGDEAAKRAYLRSLLHGIDSAAGESLLKESA
ncbi:MAG TPA: hypothetical protein VK824_10720, partial [Planctomycetota bacterium]|nr:hypothetical protein [Planctomycetota bacterium]